MLHFDFMKETFHFIQKEITTLNSLENDENNILSQS
jgi:hypothetical protein